MRDRLAVTLIVVTTFVIWMGSRVTAIALPLVALDQTGQEWTTGVVLGSQALPVVTVGWWGAGMRDRLVTGRAIGAVMLVQVAGLAIVPVAAAGDRLGVPALVASGVIVGGATALQAPAIRAVLSDVGDRLGPGRAARALTLQDFSHRCTMFIAPPLAALAVGRGQTLTLLWAECVAVALGAALSAALPRPDGDRPVRRAAPGGRSRDDGRMAFVLRAHPRMTASMLVHATVSLTWFAFSLGLAIAGAHAGRPGELIAAGMTGYGLASTATSVVAPWLVTRLPAWPTAILPAALLGAVFVALPSQLGSLVGISLLAALGGVAMPLGIGAHNRILATDPAAGADRRAAFAADQIADGGASALGMLAGGAVIATAGTTPALWATGVLQILVVLVALRAPAFAPAPAPPREPGSAPARRR